jgi:hypothetical protein
MDWILERDAKPEKWSLVNLHAESGAGEILIRRDSGRVPRGALSATNMES